MSRLGDPYGGAPIRALREGQIKGHLVRSWRVASGAPASMSATSTARSPWRLQVTGFDGLRGARVTYAAASFRSANTTKRRSPDVCADSTAPATQPRARSFVTISAAVIVSAG